MTNEEKWKAVIACNKDYDGCFYYAVKTTGIFCRPSCKAKIPLRKNILYFDNMDQALESGFRPCKMCRPDLIDAVYDPNKDLIEKYVEILDKSYKNPIQLDKTAKELGLSYNHFSKLFKQYKGITVTEYITELRISESMMLLKATDKGIITISYEVGFNSLSNFYRSFKNRTGTTPQKFRSHNFKA